MSDELPKGWAEVALAEVADCQLGKMLDKVKHVEGELLPYLRNINVRWGSIDLGDLQKMPFHEHEKLKYSISDGDVLVCEGGEPGRAAVWGHGPTDIKFQKALHRVRPAEGVRSQWIAYRLRHDAATGALTDHFTGTTIKHFPGEALARFRLPLPPTVEQRRIVEKVEALFARSVRARGELARVPRLIERYRQAVLESAFRGDLTAEWRQARNESEWRWRQVRDIGAVGLGRQRSPINHQGPDMRPYVRAANITWDGWDLSDVKEMNFDAADYARFRLHPGDVLINEGSGSAKEVGKPAIWEGQIEECCFQNTLIRVRPQECTSRYLYYYFLYAALTEKFIESTQGVNIYHIGKDGLASFPIPQPSFEEQAEIVSQLDAAFLRISRLREELLRGLKLCDILDQSILQKAFAGELVPQDPTDEPASALLARIKASRVSSLPTRKGRRPRAAGGSPS